MKKWWKDPSQKKLIALKISTTLKKKLKGDYDTMPLQKSCRYTLEYRAWKKFVLDRDNYQCKKCGFQSCKRKKKKMVDAHHIIPISKIIIDYNLKTLIQIKKNKLFNDIKNGICLCKSCHKKEHVC